MDIYVGNLPFNITEDILKATFAKFGEVSSVKIIKDKETGRSKGFGFVSMPDNDKAKEAINGLNGSDLNGRAMKVNEAKPTEKGPRGGRGGGMGGGYPGGFGR